MSHAYVLSFIQGTAIEKPSVDRIVIQMPITSTKCTLDVSPALCQVIDLLSSTGGTEDELADLVQRVDGTGSLAPFYYYLSFLAAHRVIRYSVVLEGQPLANLIPISVLFTFSPETVDPSSKYVLSRFAYLRREGDYLVLESPLAHSRVTLHHPEGAAFVAALATPRTLDSLRDRLKHLPAETVGLFLTLLVESGFVSATRGLEPCREQSEALAQWEFHDLLFHARSRLGRHAHSYGGTYPFLDRIKPLPAKKEAFAGESVELYRPDISSLKREERSFTQVLEGRRSIRSYGERPMSELQLGEFLYRSARVKELRKTEFQEITHRVYPGGGAIYELEIYVNISRCEILPAGLYHYCPYQHRLEKICGSTETVGKLLDDAVHSAALSEVPQVLITITARFQRLSWKYQSIAYSVLLKDVGALYQTMYLVATAMDLAPCALGGGNSDLFAVAAGLDYYSETSVGEFLLGSKPRA
jgi:SagB-type dehydrogenase family enzyme